LFSKETKWNEETKTANEETKPKSVHVSLLGSRLSKEYIDSDMSDYTLN
jgi:hypothetical protein